MKLPLLRRRRLDGIRGFILNLAIAYWAMSRQKPDMGVLIDWSGHGHEGYFGGVRRAFIGDDHSGGRGLHCPGIAGNYASIEEQFQRASDARYFDGTVLQTAARGLTGQRNAHKVTANDDVEYTTDLLTGALTNLVDEDDLDNAAKWIKILTPIVTGGQPDPFGGADAYTIEDDNAGGVEYLRHLTPFTGDADKSLVFAVREKAMPGAGNQTLYLRDSSAPATRLQMDITSWVAGDPQITEVAGELLHKWQVGTTGWWILECEAPSVVAANNNYIDILPATVSGQTGSIDVYRVNAYDSAVPLPMPYDASFVKAADSLFKPYVDAAGDARPVQGMTLYAKIIPIAGTGDVVSNEKVIVLGSDDGSGPFVDIRVGSGGKYAGAHFNGASPVFSDAPVAASANDLVELRMSFSSAGAIQLHQSLNGAAEADGSASADLNINPVLNLQKVAMLSNLVANQHFGAGVHFAIFADPDKPLVAIQAATRTDSDVLFWYEPGDDVFNASVVGSISVRGFTRVADWTPGALGTVMSKWTTASDQRSFLLALSATGFPQFYWSPDGTSVSQKFATATAATGETDGDAQRLRADLNKATGDVSFFLGGAGVDPEWVQLGSTVAGAGATSIHDGTAPLLIGATEAGAATLLEQTAYAAIIYSDLTETNKVVDVDFRSQAQGDRVFHAYNGALVEVNQAGSSTAEPHIAYWAGDHYLYLPGTTGNWLSTADHARLDIIGDIDVRVRPSPTDWTPSALKYLGGKWASGGNQKSWLFFLNTNGVLGFQWSEDGSASVNQQSTVATGFTDGQVGWVRATLDVDDGGGNNVVKFYTSDDGVAWTQLGTTITTGGTTSIFSSSAILGIGAAEPNGSLVGGPLGLYGAQLYDGIDGTLVFDFDPSKSFTVDQANSAVITINRSASGYKAAEITETTAIGDGVNDFISVDDHADLDAGATDGLTIAAVIRTHATLAEAGILVKKTNLKDAGTAGYSLYTPITNPTPTILVSDGTNNPSDASAAGVLGERIVAVGVRDAGETVEAFLDGVSDGGEADTSGDLSNAVDLRIMSDGAGANFFAGEWMGSPVFDRALTPAQAEQLTQELAQ